MLERHNAAKKEDVSKVKFITIFNPALPSIKVLLENTFTLYTQMKF